MQILNPEFSLEKFFNRLKNSRKSILMLDYDGTLSPFTSDRDNAQPYTGIKEQLELLIKAKATEIIIISGRDIKTLKRLLILAEYPELWGCHGAERFEVEKGYRLSVDQNVLAGLRLAGLWITEKGFNQYAEIKPAGCALHWRGLPAQTASEIKRAIEEYWQPIAGEYGLRLHEFDGGIELRPENVDKGAAVKEVLNRRNSKIPFAYLGDDLTDEDAFRAIGNKGLKVLVRQKSRKSLADIRITPPAELLEFLARWTDLTSTEKLF